MRTRQFLARSAALAAGALFIVRQPRSAAAAGEVTPVAPVTHDDVFSLDLVHRIDLTIDPSYFDTLDTDRSMRVPCEIAIDGTTFSDARIKEKGSTGSSSSIAEKTGFTVTFGDAHPAGLKKLTLNNARQDPSFLHEHLAYKLYRLAALPAPRTTHAIVSINGREYGVFVMVESVSDKRFLERAFGAGNGGGNLYEGASHDFVEGAANHDFLELKDEDEGRTRDDIAALAVAAAAPDEQFASAVGQHLDLERFITAYALDGLLGHWDGPVYRNKNFYLYSNPGDGRLVLIPHGMDMVFNVDFDPLTEPRPLVARRIRSIAALDRKLRQELNRVIAEVWNVPVLLDRMQRVATNLHRVDTSAPAVARDVAQFDATFDSMRRQVAERPGRWRPL